MKSVGLPRADAIKLSLELDRGDNNVTCRRLCISMSISTSSDLFVFSSGDGHIDYMDFIRRVKSSKGSHIVQTPESSIYTPLTEVETGREVEVEAHADLNKDPNDMYEHCMYCNISRVLSSYK